MMMFSLLTLVLVYVIQRSVANEPTVVINTSTGPVQGDIRTTVHSTTYASFKGIRYAEPPLGYLRFQPPVPIEPWTEVLNATVDRSECPQINSSADVDGSEDCLFLNVYTPVTNLSQTPKELISVMVWIYGGAFVTGSASTKNNRPDFLIERNVVLVSLNYRLGALGFLNLGHPNATGNAGLKDQNLALQWVQENIEKFGGNPKNITIFGESAGAVSVGFQVLSEKSTGLFHAAISMSGTPLVPWGFVSRSEAISRAQRLARYCGAFPWTTNQYLKTLYAAKIETLVKLEYVINPITPFIPCIEDANLTSDPFITECSIEKYQTGNFNRVPQILGFMDKETVTFLSYANEFVPLVNIAEGLRHLSGDKSGPLDVFKPLEMAMNGAGDLIGTVSQSVLDAAVNLTTDTLFKLQIDSTQKLLVNNSGNVPIYYYDITFDQPKSRHNIGHKHWIPGAGHADDLNYLFYQPANNYNLSLSDPMGLTIYRVSTMWTNFAKYGDPTPNWVDEYPLNVTWPPSGESGQALNIGNQLKVVPRPINSGTQLLENLLKPFASSIDDCSKN